MPLATLRQLTLTSLIALTLTACGGSSDGDDEPLRSSSSGSNSSESSSSTSSDSSSTTSSSSSSSSAEAEDITPNAFSFAPQEGLEPEAEAVSEEIIIEGINRAVGIRIEGGEYRLNGGEFTAENGELESGSTLTLRTTAPEELGDTQEVTVTIGTETTTWSVTTAVDDEPPQGAIAFPPPISASGAETLIIRGRASDELSGVAEVTLAVHHADDSVVPYALEADEENGFSEWQQTVSLAPGDNRIALQVKDASGNELAEPVEVTVVGQGYEAPFPDDEEKEFAIYDLVFDESNERILLTGEDRSDTATAKRVVISVDLETGKRTPFVTLGGENEALGSFYLTVGDIDYSKNRLIAGQRIRDLVYEFDLDTGLGSVLVDGSVGEGASGFEDIDHFVLSKLDSDHLYMAVYDFDNNPQLIKKNLATGETTVVSSEVLGVGEGDPVYSVRQIVLSEDEKMAYMNSGLSLYLYDLTTGDREAVPLNYDTEWPLKALSDMVQIEPNKFLVFENYLGLMLADTLSGSWEIVRPYDSSDFLETRIAHGVHYLEEDNYFFMAQRHSNTVYAYDVELNQAVIITRYSE